MSYIGHDEQFNPATGRYEPAIPLPFYYGLFPWLWLRLTGYRDEYGRKAQLLSFREFWDFDDAA